jgi:hypothetical protein
MGDLLFGLTTAFNYFEMSDNEVWKKFQAMALRLMNGEGTEVDEELQLAADRAWGSILLESEQEEREVSPTFLTQKAMDAIETTTSSFGVETWFAYGFGEAGRLVTYRDEMRRVFDVHFLKKSFADATDRKVQSQFLRKWEFIMTQHMEHDQGPVMLMTPSSILSLADALSRVKMAGAEVSTQTVRGWHRYERR